MDGRTSSSGSDESGRTSAEFRPGETISPRTASPMQTPIEQPTTQTPSNISSASIPEPAIPQPLTGFAAQTPASSQQSAVSVPERPAPSPYSIEEDLQPDSVEPRMHSNGSAVTWTASEFIAHHKSPSWYVTLGVVSVVFAAVVFLLTKDKISTFVILLCAAMFGFYGARKPRELSYSLDHAGLRIGNRQYSYSEFRSFGIADEGAFSSLVFMPLKRFGQMISVLYDPADEERILDVLAENLPMQDHVHDTIDTMMRRIRF